MVGPAQGHRRDGDGRVRIDLRAEPAQGGEGVQLRAGGRLQQGIDPRDAGLLHRGDGLGTGLIILGKELHQAGILAAHEFPGGLGAHLLGDLLRTRGIPLLQEPGGQGRGRLLQLVVQALQRLGGLQAVIRRDDGRRVRPGGGKSGQQQKGEEQVFHGSVGRD